MTPVTIRPQGIVRELAFRYSSLTTFHVIEEVH